MDECSHCHIRTGSTGLNMVIFVQPRNLCGQALPSSCPLRQISPPRCSETSEDRRMDPRGVWLREVHSAVSQVHSAVSPRGFRVAGSLGKCYVALLLRERNSCGQCITSAECKINPDRRRCHRLTVLTRQCLGLILINHQTLSLVCVWV